MAKQVYVYSKAANTQSLVIYKKKASGDKVRGVNKHEKIVVINGGAGVTDKVTRRCPKAVETILSAEDFDAIKELPSWKKFCANGFMLSSDKQLLEEEAAAKLNGEDKSAALTEKKVQSRAKKAGVKGKVEIKAGDSDE
jgi:hypothetical protein